MGDPQEAMTISPEALAEAEKLMPGWFVVHMLKYDITIDSPVTRNHAAHCQPIVAAAIQSYMDRITELETALGWFVADAPWQVGIGGNPIAVERMIAEAQAIYRDDARASRPDRRIRGGESEAGV